MWVSKLRVKVEFEILVQVELLVTHLDVFALAPLDDGTSVDRLNHGIDGVLQILNQHWLSSLDRKLQSLNHLGVAQSRDLQVVLLFFFSDPRDSLELRINDE